MAEKESSDATEVEHSYLDAGSTGPRRWLLVIGAIVVGAAIMAAFYGLYSINRDVSPTLTPDPLILTAAAISEARPSEASPSAPPNQLAATPSPSMTLVITATAEPPSYTVQQGDTLLAIAHHLNVSVAALQALNHLSGETIYPEQVLLVPPTSTPWPETGPFPHIINQGETLLSIAGRYQVSVQEIKALNGLTSDTIYGGQQILIPAEGVRPPTPTPTPEPWQPAVITGELDAIYSLTSIKGHFTLHIPPDTRAAADSEVPKVARLVETALDYAQQALQHRVSGRFDVYVTESLFDIPYSAQRSLSQPQENRLFLLYDGSGTLAERRYFGTIALTHLMAGQILGEAAAPLLTEGLAVFAGGQALTAEMPQGQHYLTPTEFCVAYQRTGKLVRLSNELAFEGHLGHMDRYFAAGCFVAYLLEQQGFSKFSQVYLDGDFRGAYGRTLNQLEADWAASLRDADIDLPVDSDELVRIAEEIDSAYRRLWEGFEGTPAQFAVYQQLDRTRLSLLLGRLSVAQEHLTALEELWGDR